MGSALAIMPLGRFAESLSRVSPSLDDAVIARLFAHYQELVRWNRTISLVAPCPEDELVHRHYGESLAALPLLSRSAGSLLDVGSGAGFPGFVLACARPDIAATLVEPKERKWAFLLAAARRAHLSCRCLNARVDPAHPGVLPSVTDLVTSRALSLTGIFASLARLVAPGGSLLLWVGRQDPPRLGGFRLAAEVGLPGDYRRICQLQRIAS